MWTSNPIIHHKCRLYMCNPQAKNNHYKLAIYYGISNFFMWQLRNAGTRSFCLQVCHRDSQAWCLSWELQRLCRIADLTHPIHGDRPVFRDPISTAGCVDRQPLSYPSTEQARYQKGKGTCRNSGCLKIPNNWPSISLISATVNDTSLWQCDTWQRTPRFPISVRPHSSH